MINSGDSSVQKHKTGIVWIVFIIILIHSTSVFGIAKKESVILSSSNTSTTTQAATPAPLANPILNYNININAQSAIVVEVGRGMRLYLKNSDLKSKIPVASKIITAIIALETLPLDTKVTISKVAAGQTDASALSLNNGEKYSLEYLLYGMLLKDSNAAAIAIAEQISGEEATFVKLMNNKAITYQMNNTIYTNVTGVLDEAQYSTVSDVARLVRFALTFPKFEEILKTKDIPFFLSTDKTKHLVNNLEKAWSLVDTTTGAYQSTSDAQSSFVTTSFSSGISIITVACTTSKNRILDDITTISNSIFSDYEFSNLAMEGQIFPKSLLIGKDTIELKFTQEINYVHPRDLEFIASTIYEENAIVEYPVMTSKAVAKVMFELLDGTKITADLYPTRTVWGESSYYQKFLSIYNANRDIGVIVIISLILLFLLCIYHLIRQLVRFFKFLFKISNDKRNHTSLDPLKSVVSDMNSVEIDLAVKSKKTDYDIISDEFLSSRREDFATVENKSFMDGDSES